MTPQDIAFGALCAWRENRGGGQVGMQSVINTLQNRSREEGKSIYEIATAPLQYSSMSAPGDPQLTKFGLDGDAQWIEALALMEQAAAGQLPDITGGATNYYATSMSKPPWWAASMDVTVTIANQIFLRKRGVTDETAVLHETPAQPTTPDHNS